LRRREFITLLGAAATWPLAARVQQGELVRRICVLMNLASDDAEGQARLAAFVQDLQQLGWRDGRNVRIDYRWAAGDARLFHRSAEELLALAPNVILASATPSVQALQQATRTVPVVFAMVGDPVGMGVVASPAHPGTPPVLPPWNSASARNGWSCSKRSASRDARTSSRFDNLH
jgi:putative ABC transport system substrate-binding protein